MRRHWLRGHFSFGFSFRFVTPLMEHGNTFFLMFGILWMHATQLPRKMMEWMRLTVVHCAPRSTPLHFVVNAMKKNIVLSVLTHRHVGAKLFVWHAFQEASSVPGFEKKNCLFGTIHVTCAEVVEFIALVLCCVLSKEGFGVGSGLFGGLIQGRVKLGLK